jgi:hypothetical integral membrane protein (TIGR02206 family)
VITITTIVIALLLLKNQNKNNHKKWRRFEIIFGVYLIFQQFIYSFWQIYIGGHAVARSLPLHLCGFSILISSIMLFKRSRFLAEVLYFIGVGGAIQAFVTPDLDKYSFPHFLFFHMFISHATLAFAPLYMVVVKGFRPRLVSIGKALVFITAASGLVGFINWVLQFVPPYKTTNYFYLCRPPSTPSLIDWLGPWPWYLMPIAGLAVINFVVLYLPVAGIDHYFRNYKNNKDQSQ